jgi:hypothetical protein
MTGRRIITMNWQSLTKAIQFIESSLTHGITLNAICQNMVKGINKA